MQDLHKYKWFLPVLVLLSSIAVRAIPFPSQEEDYNTILIDIRDHRFSEVRQYLNTLLNHPESPGETEKLILSELLIYNNMLQEFGAYKIESKIKLNSYNNINNDLYKALHLLNNGLYKLLYEYDDEVSAMKNLNEALYIAVKEENEVLICEIIKAILLYYDRLINIKDDGYKRYLPFYQENSYDTIEKNIYLLLSIHLKLFTEPIDTFRGDLMHLENIKEEIQHPYYKAHAYKTLGIYYDKDRKDHKKAYTYFNRAATYFKGINIVGEQAALISEAIAKYNQGEYRNAIKILNNETLYLGKSMEWNTIYHHIWLSKSYAKLKSTDSAYHHLDESRKLRNKLDQTRHNVAINRIKAEIDPFIKAIKDLEAEKDNLTTKNNALKILFYVLVPILILIYYLFRSYKKKSVVLETEKSETLKKLDQLENIIIKNHIILKDKTKIYITDLLYIKSDGPYLNIFLSDGNKHFVRGKLSQIKEELPVNFIQCHRSYIVNSNFIKQTNNNSIILINKERIPLSRTYKTNFK